MSTRNILSIPVSILENPALITLHLRVPSSWQALFLCDGEDSLCLCEEPSDEAILGINVIATLRQVGGGNDKKGEGLTMREGMKSIHFL
ncbi:MAG: hypothetical protein OEV57_04620 [Dehalococcoidia bacterium]|nr:hypothetical protein [Dehalococcoidia bacterium]